MTSPREQRERGEVDPARSAGAGEGTTQSAPNRRPKRKRAVERTIEHSRELRRDHSDAEEKLWGSLRNRRLQGLKFRRQYAIGKFIADFACPEAGLVIEVDGGQHAFTKAEDEARTLKLNKFGYRVMRFWANEVMNRLDDVLIEILKVTADPSPGAKTRRPLPVRVAHGARS